MELNGDKPLPGIQIAWDAEAKGVALQIDPDFKNLDFVLACLDMAKMKVEYMKKTQQLQAMKQMEAEAREANRIAKIVRGN